MGPPIDPMTAYDLKSKANLWFVEKSWPPLIHREIRSYLALLAKGDPQEHHLAGPLELVDLKVCIVLLFISMNAVSLRAI